MSAKTITVATRVEPELKVHLMKEAELRGMDLASFIRACLEEKLEDSEQIPLSSLVVDQIYFLKQIVFNGFDWNNDENLVKKEVEHLWNMTQVRKISQS